ncbi:TetR/AcrR family transcriptional regulator [Chryseobacterium populi]|nr:TetR/AcrR family transcriptional regulator [Chryseobacterium populi]
MGRKTVEGAIRNKEKSKQKLLDAVGKILKTKGFSALKVNYIAETAGLDKKLIYNYFGGIDQLIDQYLQSEDFWSILTKKVSHLDVNDGGQALSKALLLSQFDYVYENTECQKIILWGLSENRKSLKKLAKNREIEGELVFKNIFDQHFGSNACLYRAIAALLISGIYYLDIFATTKSSTFCGLDLNSKTGRAEIQEAISFIVSQAYLNL